MKRLKRDEWKNRLPFEAAAADEAAAAAWDEDAAAAALDEEASALATLASEADEASSCACTDAALAVEVGEAAEVIVETTTNEDVDVDERATADPLEERRAFNDPPAGNSSIVASGKK